MPSPRPSGAITACCVLFIALMAALTAVIGNGSALPPDEHEVLVARTAEEMLARGEFIVPYFNDAPRVNKPPLNYWLVMAADQVNGGNGIVGEWEARVPSMAAGVLLACCACVLGLVWFDLATGLVAGLILASCTGFMAYTHSARPEMVYAALCAAGLVGFAIADALHRGRARMRMSDAATIVGWLMFGLALLSKGPQLPLLLVAGYAAGLAAQGRTREMRTILRPMIGIVIAAAPALAWYIALRAAAPETQGMADREILGRVFNLEAGRAWRYLDPYYIYRAAGLVLPWALMYAAALTAPWVKELRASRSTLVAWCIIIVPLLVLHVSLGRRWYYALPLLAPLAVLMAAAMLRIGDGLAARGSTRAWRWLWRAHVAALAFTPVVCWLADNAVAKPPLWMVVCTTIAGVLLLAALFSNHLWSMARPAHVAAATCTLAAGVLWTLSARASIWDSSRFSIREFAHEVGRVVAADEPLVGFGNDWQTEQYYLHRAIPTLNSFEAVAQIVEDSGSAWLLIDPEVAARGEPSLAATVALRASYLDNAHRTRYRELWRITLK